MQRAFVLKMQSLSHQLALKVLEAQELYSMRAQRSWWGFCGLS